MSKEKYNGFGLKYKDSYVMGMIGTTEKDLEHVQKSLWRSYFDIEISNLIHINEEKHLFGFCFDPFCEIRMRRSEDRCSFITTYSFDIENTKIMISDLAELWNFNPVFPNKEYRNSTKERNIERMVSSYSMAESLAKKNNTNAENVFAWNSYCHFLMMQNVPCEEIRERTKRRLKFDIKI